MARPMEPRPYCLYRLVTLLLMGCWAEHTQPMRVMFDSTIDS